ncbi:MAG TPA: hypothetical protein PLA13_05925 [Microbacteriaceae bacterium]|jgi:hypothetical protein|nr:hypothetical protein [Microbacteriaceae bacterium]HQX35876.1 hypothetical protein [Microbacteriaceae bacterium]HQZ48701.1 hypothetical protein [Microbacteriaceae bacterium]HRA08534.1 hypothetical protein [Microbacteriaceae bacterium]
MTHHTPAPTTTTLSSATTAWVWGGSAILVSGLLRLLEALPISAVIGWRPVTLIAAVVFAIGAVILAVGVRGQGSVVARSGLGIAALCVLGGIDVLQAVLVESFAMIPASFRDGVTGIANVLVLIQLAAAVVGAIVIGRSGGVVGVLRWLPAFVLACIVALQITTRVFLNASGGVGSSGMEVVVAAQVSLALLQSALGFVVLLASPRADATPPAAT